MRKHIYFLGIGGIGMSNLARYYNLAGVKVSGYDKTPSSVTQALQNEGISINFDENLQQFEGITDLVYTPAIKQHLAFEMAKKKRIVPMKRSQVLGEICKHYQALAVAGTHGKTTTSTMLAHLTRFCGVDTTAFLGGISKNLQGNFAYGKSEYCVVEADEFDRSFLTLFPKYAIITSLDADHLDIYGKHEDMLDTYRMFGKQVSDKLLVNSEIANFDWQREVISYGIESGKYQAQNLRFANLATTFDYVSEEITIKDIVLPMPGKHNVANATAAITLTLWAGGDMEKVKNALANFKGIERRFEVVMHTDSISLINDYAHHPTELAAAIGTAKSLFPDRQVVAIFQPHLFTRTRDFYEGFAEALSMADAAILIPIYPAREKPIEGITSDIILQKISIEKKVLIEKTALNDTIQAFMEKPTIVLILGAGDIDREIGKLKFNH